jgi:hypothetical protein
MAITGAAAIAGIAAGAAGVSTAVIAVAGLAITAVGMITKNQTLMKIGGGIGLGGAASGLASAASSAAASGATDAAAQGIAAPSIADAAGAGSQAAGNVAESSLASSVPGLEGVSYAGSGLADTSGLVSGAAQTSTDAAITGASGLSGEGTVAPVDASLNGASSNSISANLASQSPASAAVQNDVAASNIAPVNTNPANVVAPNTNPANANTIAQNAAGSSPVAPGAQAAAPGSQTVAAQAGQAGTGAPMGFDSAGAYTPVPNGLQNPSSWWTDAQQWFTNPKNNGLMQLGGGLIKGVGQGVGAMIQSSTAGKLTDQQKWEQANMTGAASVPTVGISPSGAKSPYPTPQQIQQRASQAVNTTTPPYQGIINKNRS